MSTHLNPEQLAAVNVTNGAYSVVAGPGSGKTTVLVNRYRKLRDLVSVDEILSLTFTKSAADNMRKKAGESEIGSRPCGFSTFHSFCLAVASKEYTSYRYPLKPFPLATPGQTIKMLGLACREFSQDFRQARQWIGLQKRNFLTAEQSFHTEDKKPNGLVGLASTYCKYEEQLEDAGLLDFDSLLMETVKMFGCRPEVKERYQYYFVQCDEAQDTDAVQLKLIQQLSDKYRNVFFVGDVNQSIYQWRGGSSEFLVNFDSFFPDGETMYLVTNYRATKRLTDFNYKIAPFRPPDRYTTPNEDGVDPEVRSFPSELDEAVWVARECDPRPRDMFDNPVGKSEDHPSIAILARTNRSLLHFEESLSEQGVRYHLLGKSGFWMQPEVKNVMAWVQCLVAPTDAAIQAAIKSPFHPTRFMKKQELIDSLKRSKNRSSDFEPTMFSLLIKGDYEMENSNQERLVDDFSRFIRSLSGRYRSSTAAEAVQGVIRDLQAAEYYRDEEEAFDNDPLSNLRELQTIASRFPTVHSFLDYVRKIKGASKNKKGVAIGTVHSAKGLEWNTVFLVNCQEGILPHSKGELEEEKRIFFVGCSRAARRLVITHTGFPSRFIENMGTSEQNGGVMYNQHLPGHHPTIGEYRGFELSEDFF